MTERELPSPFEARLAGRLGMYADIPLRKLDAHAAWALELGARRRGTWAGIPLPGPSILRWAAVGALLLALAAVGLLVAGMIPNDNAPRRGLLVYASSTGGLYLADADGHGAHQIWDGLFAEPKWSPDGRFIAVRQEPTQLLILRVDGTLVDDRIGCCATDYAWAPGTDSARLAFLFDGAVMVEDVDLGSTITVAPGSDTTISWAWTSNATLAWTDAISFHGAPGNGKPDVLHVVQIDRQGQDLVALPLRDTPFGLPAAPTYRGFDDLRVSPDGHTMAILARINLQFSTELGTMPVNGGTLGIITRQLQPYGRLAWSSDSRSLLVETIPTNAKVPTGLVVVPVDGGPQHQLVPAQISTDDWVLVDDSPWDAAGGPILFGKVAGTVTSADGQDRTVLDLWMTTSAGLRPQLLVREVLGADIFWLGGG